MTAAYMYVPASTKQRSGVSNDKGPFTPRFNANATTALFPMFDTGNVMLTAMLMLAKF